MIYWLVIAAFLPVLRYIAEAGATASIVLANWNRNRLQSYLPPVTQVRSDKFIVEESKVLVRQPGDQTTQRSPVNDQMRACQTPTARYLLGQTTTTVRGTIDQLTTEMTAALWNLEHPLPTSPELLRCERHNHLLTRQLLLLLPLQGPSRPPDRHPGVS